MTPWTVAHKVPLSVEFSGQEYWSGLPFPSPEDLPDLGIKPMSPALAGEFFITETPGNLRGVKIKDPAGLVSPGGSRGNSIPCLLRLPETASIH